MSSLKVLLALFGKGLPMSELYNRYIAGKKPAEITHNVVTDIRRGRISGDNLKLLIVELEKKGIFDNTTITTTPKSEWNEEYLELLSYETVGGTFSRQYLLHLAEVADYVQVNSATKKHTKVNKIKVVKGVFIFKVILALALLGLAVWGVIWIISLLKG